MAMARKKYWMQDAVKRPGSLRAWLKRNKRRVAAAIKEDPFTRDGKIKVTALKKLRNTNLYEKLSSTRKKQINLAIIFSKYRKKGK
jgi:hypothetical protein